jgi:hypothetical protein
VFVLGWAGSGQRAAATRPARPCMARIKRRAGPSPVSPRRAPLARRAWAANWSLAAVRSRSSWRTCMRYSWYMAGSLSGHCARRAGDHPPALAPPRPAGLAGRVMPRFSHGGCRIVETVLKPGPGPTRATRRGGRRGRQGRPWPCQRGLPPGVLIDPQRCTQAGRGPVRLPASRCTSALAVSASARSTAEEVGARSVSASSASRRPPRARRAGRAVWQR